MAKNKNEKVEQVVEIEQVKEKETKYNKKQLVASKKYSAERDLLQVLLEENKSYSLKEVNNKLKEFKERKV